MRTWLETALSRMSLSEEIEGYVLGRGVDEALAAEIRLCEWTGEPGPAPDPVFTEKFGKRLERLRGKLVYPLLGPSGHLLGIEARSWQGDKRISQYLLPEGDWNPVFIGLTPSAMGRIWDGADVAIVEGLFDLAAVLRAVRFRSSWRSGVPRDCVVLATLRARLSKRHAAFLERFCRGVVHMVYDNDETGHTQTFGNLDEKGNIKASALRAQDGNKQVPRIWGALKALQRVGVRCEAVAYKGKDPGEIWDHGGDEGLRRAFEGRF